MAVCKTELQLGVANLSLSGSREVVSVPKVANLRWPSGRVSARVAMVRCSAASGDGQQKKNFDLNEVVEKVVHEEENQIPEEEKRTPDPLPEGEPSPFSPAIDTDETKPFQGEGVSKDSLIEPPRGLHEGAASSSIGEGLGGSEQSALTADIGGSPVSGPGGHGRDWRVKA